MKNKVELYRTWSDLGLEMSFEVFLDMTESQRGSEWQKTFEYDHTNIQAQLADEQYYVDIRPTPPNIENRSKMNRINGVHPIEWAAYRKFVRLRDNKFDDDTDLSDIGVFWTNTRNAFEYFKREQYKAESTRVEPRHRKDDIRRETKQDHAG